MAYQFTKKEARVDPAFALLTMRAWRTIGQITGSSSPTAGNLASPHGLSVFNGFATEPGAMRGVMQWLAAGGSRHGLKVFRAEMNAREAWARI
jgi:hypothetical protein